MLEVSESNVQRGGEAPADKLEVCVRESVILVRDPNTLFYAFYATPAQDSPRRKDGFVASEDRPKVCLLRRRPTRDRNLITRARQAAEQKARELGWIV